ncbi:MAG: hypothetical protein ABL856_06885 [Gallionella sp.]
MSDDNQLDNVDQRKLVENKPHHEGEWTEIGEAEVTVDIFGHAKVHVIRQHDQARRNRIIAGICLVLLAAVVGLYMLSGEETPEPTDPAMNLNSETPATVIAEPAVSAVVAPVVVASPQVVKPQARAVVRVTPPPAVTTVTPVVVAKPAPVIKPKLVVIESVPPKAAEVIPSELISPIKPAEPVVVPAKPHGEITY